MLTALAGVHSNYTAKDAKSMYEVIDNYRLHRVLEQVPRHSQCDYNDLFIIIMRPNVLLYLHFTTCTMHFMKCLLRCNICTYYNKVVDSPQVGVESEGLTANTQSRVQSLAFSIGSIILWIGSPSPLDVLLLVHCSTYCVVAPP